MGDDGPDEGRQQPENKRGQGLADVLEQFLKARDLRDHIVDGLDDLVAEHQDGVDLLGDLDRVEIRTHAGYDVGVVSGAIAQPIARILLLLLSGHGSQVPCLRGKAVADTGELRDEGDEVLAAG